MPTVFHSSKIFCDLNIPFITKALLTWFAENKRDLPFRHADEQGRKDPYAIWISEIMAQQTQIDILLPYYERFIHQFPDVATLAAAEEDAVLKAWEGLGYYSRARNLRKAAQTIQSDFNGRFPATYADILSLPGIGPYTAGAVASIAFGLPVAAVDGNVMRVITRLADWPVDIAGNDAKRKIGAVVTDLMPKEAPGDFNEALMELGALVCTPNAPACLLCPWRIHCRALACGRTESLPVKTKRVRHRTLTMAVALVTDMGGRLLIEKRPTGGLLAGLWGLPIVEADDSAAPLNAALSARLDQPMQGLYLGTAKHVFTHRTWRMRVYHYTVDAFPDGCVVADRNDLRRTYALPTAFSKLLPLLKQS
ncbi:A/G-specific adenine glycosylase [Pseudoramibacter faecis]|uniref:A/G-specific adenine glycosylase n=1 Tax=Pseudoramibacter faecis TaxID=3108534 RepID=UPI002E796862|nr:A/G-specific adenine glycosylase [Pseudoramibacter sp. HA2172]